MKIISMSLEDELVSEIEAFQEVTGVKGRSKLIRDALRLLVDQHKEENLEGFVDGVLVVTHEDKTEEVGKIKHDFNDVIKTQVHNHLKNGDCMEVFMLRGHSSSVKALKAELSASSSVKKVRLVIV